MIRSGFQPESFSQRQAGTLPALLGIEVDSLAEGTISASMEVRGDHMAPNGFLHAASVIALADTTAGYGCMAHLPEGASGFTTIELKANFLGTAGVDASPSRHRWFMAGAPRRSGTRSFATRPARRSGCFAARRWSCGPRPESIEANRRACAARLRRASRQSQ